MISQAIFHLVESINNLLAAAVNLYYLWTRGCNLIKLKIEAQLRNKLWSYNLILSRHIIMLFYERLIYLPQTTSILQCMQAYKLFPLINWIFTVRMNSFRKKKQRNLSAQSLIFSCHNWFSQSKKSLRYFAEAGDEQWCAVPSKFVPRYFFVRVPSVLFKICTVVSVPRYFFVKVLGIFKPS